MLLNNTFLNRNQHFLCGNYSVRPWAYKDLMYNLFKSSQLPGEIGHLSPLLEMRKLEAQRGKILCPGPPSRSQTE